MRALQYGSQGGDVKKWQYFLCGQGYNKVIADGIFGRITDLATKNFQLQQVLVPDGLVGTFTYAKAGILGFELVKNPFTENPEGLHWPLIPVFKPLTQSGYRRIFGSFSFQLKPDPNPNKALLITCGWEKENLVSIPAPLFSALPPYRAKRIKVHQKVVHQFERLFKKWKSAGLAEQLLTFDCGYYPRMTHGSKNQVSAHSYGIAIDINASWNNIGKIPPKNGQQGSVRQLVEIAHENGFYWGGHFQRQDGMHFEIAEVQ